MGSLAYIRVKEGDEVSAGQVVAGLDEDVLRAALKMAQAAKDARGRLESAEADFRLQSERLEKLLGLYERRHASQDEVLRARAQKEISEAQVKAVRDELEVKSAEYDRIEAQLEQTRIKSPIDGVVTRVFKDPGEFISAADPVVLKVVELDTLLVVFSVPAPMARGLNVDQSVDLEVGENRERVSGVIEFVSPTADAQSGTSRVKVRLPNPEGRFHSGDACWLNIDGRAGTAANSRRGATTTRNVSRNTATRNPRDR
jgi:RND family efflux transporter MFP subunit